MLRGLPEGLKVLAIAPISRADLRQLHTTLPRGLEMLSARVYTDNIMKPDRSKLTLAWGSEFPRLRYLDLFISIRGYNHRWGDVYQLQWSEWVPSLEHLCISNPVVSLPSLPPSDGTSSSDPRHPPPNLLSLEIYADVMGRLHVPPSVRDLKLGIFKKDEPGPKYYERLDWILREFRKSPGTCKKFIGNPEMEFHATRQYYLCSSSSSSD